jgi:hypothetical protein
MIHTPLSAGPMIRWSRLIADEKGLPNLATAPVIAA